MKMMSKLPHLATTMAIPTPMSRTRLGQQPIDSTPLSLRPLRASPPPPHSRPPTPRLLAAPPGRRGERAWLGPVPGPRERPCRSQAWYRRRRRPETEIGRTIESQALISTNKHGHKQSMSHHCHTTRAEWIELSNGANHGKTLNVFF